MVSINYHLIHEFQYNKSKMIAKKQKEPCPHDKVFFV